MKYRYRAEDAVQKHKFGIDLTVYGMNVDTVNVVHVSVDEGHFEEFYSQTEHYVYYIYEGSGVFFLDDEKVEAQATDLIVIPPKTRIYYFGTMKMVLSVSPAFREENQVHVRDVPRSESPFIEEEV